MKYHLLTVVVFSAIVSHIAIAKEGNWTTEFVGHRPTVSDVRIDKTTPTLGDTLTVNYNYSDVDGDADASTIQWYYNGQPVPGQTARQYTPVLNINNGRCHNIPINVEVKPKSHTGDPSVGLNAMSAQATLNPPVIPGVTIPDLNYRGSASDALNYCAKRNAKLPTIAQLQAIFSNSTSGNPGAEMAEKFGWPLSGGRCGGLSNYYWTSEQLTPFYHYFVNMSDGSSGNRPASDMLYVVCILP